MTQPNRLAAHAAHGFGGSLIDRGRPLQFRLDGQRIAAFAGDTVLSAMLAAGHTTYGHLGEHAIGMTDRFVPLVRTRSGDVLPADRLPAADGLDLAIAGTRRTGWRRAPVLDLAAGLPDTPWAGLKPIQTLATDLLVIGGGVAGLAAARAAATAGHGVILVERRLWLGGDAPAFGTVGDTESADAALRRLTADLGPQIVTGAEIVALHDGRALLHRIENGHGQIVEIVARRTIIATGALQRLPLFAGNRQPGLVGGVAAWHLAERYGVAVGTPALVATASNHAYRLALALHEAGLPIRRIVDVRVDPQSRFVDFAKAGGLTISGGQFPLAATRGETGLAVQFANIGAATAAASLEAGQLILWGAFQPDLTLWMMAGGGTHWQGGHLAARGQLERVALAGAAAGNRSLAACIASGEQAVARLFDHPLAAVAETSVDPALETPDAVPIVAPPLAAPPTFLDAGTSLIMRAVEGSSTPVAGRVQSPALGDVVASVDLGLILPADAGAVAEERGAPGTELSASDWTPHPQPAEDAPQWLAGRFGPDTVRHRLVVDGRRIFGRGALVFANTDPFDPERAIGVIVEASPNGAAGGIALLSATALATVDRFIVETMDGPSPARIADD